MAHRARYGCSKGGVLISALLVAVCACGAACGAQGDELAQAREAMGRQEWARAVRVLEGAKGLEAVAQGDAVEAALARCRMHKRLEERYRDGSLAKWMGELDRRQGRALVADLVEHVESRGLEQIEPREWVGRALEVVKAGLENRCVCEQVGCECVGAAALCCVVDQLRKEEVDDALVVVRAMISFWIRTRLLSNQTIIE